MEKRKRERGNNRPTESDGCAILESNAPSISAPNQYLFRDQLTQLQIYVRKSIVRSIIIDS